MVLKRGAVIMPAKPSTVTLIPKYERLQQIAAHLPELHLDVPAFAAYLALVSVADELGAANAEYYARHNLSEGRLCLLVALLEHLPKALAPSELAELAGVTRGNVTGLIDGLERDGHVKRQVKGRDRRMTPIALTSAGRKLARTLLADRAERVQNLMRRLSPAERDALLSMLGRIHEGLPKFSSA